MTKKKTFAQIVREKYGDSVEDFAKRLNTLPITVKRWEAGQRPQELARALLKYANEYTLTISPRITDYFIKLHVREQVLHIMKKFNDNQRSFAKRIGVSHYTVNDWINRNTISPIAQRYIYEINSYPERFNDHD